MCVDEVENLTPHKLYTELFKLNAKGFMKNPAICILVIRIYFLAYGPLKNTFWTVTRNQIFLFWRGRLIKFQMKTLGLINM